MKYCIVLFVMLWLTEGFGQDKKAYRLFDAEGQEVGYREMMNVLEKQDVVFIGEIHNCPIVHWLEYEIVKDLCEKHKDRLALGAEMFESDNQLIIDEYLGKLITSDRFEEEARLWPNYGTDYSNVVWLAREYNLPLIATNVPRRYANMVKNGGFEALEKLSPEARKYMAPLPINYGADSTSGEAFGLMMLAAGKKSNPENLAKAQAIKDATMAWLIAQNLKSKFVHLNGNLHSDFKKGIVSYLNEYRSGLKIATVCSVRQDKIDRLDKENEGRADYYICVPTDMITTY